MITKIKILSNETIKRNLKFINSKDKHLFLNDLSRKVEESHILKLKNCELFPDGKLNILNKEIFEDYIGISSISNFFILKKILLSALYVSKILIQNLLIRNKINSEDFLVIHNRNSLGYFHWTSDTLPKILIINNFFKNIKLMLPYNLNIKFVRESLNFFKVKFVFAKKNYKYYGKNIYYIKELYPSGSPRLQILNKLRKKFKFENNVYKRLYISRAKSKRRRLSNESEVIKVLKKYNFNVLYSEKLNFKDQIKIFSSAKFVVGLHGAGLSNIVWMKKNSFLFELKPENEKYLNCYFNLSDLLSIKYNYILCKKKEFFKSSKTSDYSVDVKIFEKKLKKLLADEK